MNLIHLKYFIKLAELEHYTKSAKELNITQPSLSHAINTLESTINVKLFEKKGRNVVLTKIGKTFYNIIKHAVDEIDQSIEYIQQIQKGEGDINIGFPLSLGYYTVPLLCSEYKNINSNKKINFKFFNFEEDKLISGLENKEFDIILTTKKVNNKNIKFLPIAIQNYKLVVSKNHPLATKKEVSIYDILDETFISLNNNNAVASHINAFFYNYNVKPNITFSLENENGIAGLINQNFGISILPETPILDALQLASVDLKEKVCENYIYIAYYCEDQNTPLIYNFVNFANNFQFNKYFTNIK